VSSGAIVPGSKNSPSAARSDLNVRPSCELRPDLPETKKIKELKHHPIDSFDYQSIRQFKKRRMT